MLKDALLGAHHYDDFFARRGRQFDTPWAPADVLAETRGSQRVWVFSYQTAAVPAAQIPYKKLDNWHMGKLDLALYEVSPAR